MEMMKIIILDFSTSEVYIYNFDPNIWESGSDFLASEDNIHSETNCHWMIVDTLTIHNN